VDGFTGVVSTIAGSGFQDLSSSYCLPDGTAAPATKWCLSGPKGVALSPTGDVLISDSLHSRVLRLWRQNNTMTVVAGCGSQGFWGDGGPATEACLYQPRSAAFHPMTGDIVIVDSGNARVRTINGGTGVITTTVGSGVPSCKQELPSRADAVCLLFPTSVAWDTQGNMILAEPNAYHLLRVDAVTHMVTALAGAGYDACAYANYPYNGVPPLQACVAPLTVKVLWPSNTIIVADAANTEIRRIVDQHISSISPPLQNSEFCGDGSFATQACLSYPQGVTVDHESNVIITDTLANRVRRVNRTSGVITTLAGGGDGAACLLSNVGDGGSATEACLYRPSQTLVNNDSSMFVLDVWNNRVRQVN
jgi:DNA-binding beta-propeller fold protein YncE